MSCAAIESLLVSEAGRIGSDIYRRTLDTSMWLKLVPQEEWVDEMGDTVNVLVYERSLPANPLTFTNVGLSTAGRTIGQSFPDTNENGIDDNAVTNGGSCVPTAQKIQFGQTLRQYNLQQSALESPDICLNDLRFPVKRKEQMANIMDVLTENTSYAWKERYRDEYVRVAKHKVIVKSTLPEGTTTFPEQTPTSVLTAGVLQHFYLKLVRDGGGTNPMSRDQGAPVFLLNCSAETSQKIIKDNDDIRQDFHWSDRANELLAPMGINRPYNGFFHSIESFPPRYDFVSGNANGQKWVRRYPYAAVATTKGISFEVNSAYEAAEYEDSIIFHSDVYKSLVPRPLTGTNGQTFDAQSFRGDFRWRNIPDRVCNPDGNIGYYRAIFANGSKPVHPQYGYVLRHKRCPLDLGLTDCPS